MAEIHRDHSPPPDRIMLLIDHFRNTNAGTENQLSQLIRGLAARGAQCHLAVLTGSEYLSRSDLPCTWSVLGHSSLRSPRSWAAMYRLGRRLSRHGYRLAQTFFNDVSVLAPPMLRAAGLRTVISRRDMGFWYTPGYLRILRHTGRYVAACVANSRAVAEITVHQERLPPDRVHVIYNGLPAAENHADTQEVRELDALKRSGRVLCGVVANIRPIKRLEDLIEALGRIADRVPQLDVVVIGAGDPATLRETAGRCEVDERVHFLGARSDVPDCLAYLDIGALCSESEGFSNSLIEYMRAGLPTIATDAGGNPEAVVDGETGVLYGVGDVDALAQQLRELATNSDLRARLGAQARETARRRFSMQHMVEDHIALYRKLEASEAR